MPSPWNRRSATSRFDVPLPHRFELEKGGEAMRTYERPTLKAAGSFASLTGVGGSGPRDLLFRHQAV
jgi:hypothetical protein